jgi:hypothetical protein
MLILDKAKWTFIKANRALKWLFKLTETSTSSVKSRGGVVLPRELWDMIFAYITEDLKQLKSKFGSDYVLVQAEISRDAAFYTTLRCVEIDFKTTVKCGKLDSLRALECVEGYIRDPSEESRPIYTTICETLPVPAGCGLFSRSDDDDPFGLTNDEGAIHEDVILDISVPTIGSFSITKSEDRNSENGDLENEDIDDEESNSPDIDNDVIIDLVEPTIGFLSITKLAGPEQTLYVDIVDDEDLVIDIGHNADEGYLDALVALDSARRWQASFLFHKVGVPDIISYFEGGKCNFCSISRFKRSIYYLPGHSTTIRRLMWSVSRCPNVLTDHAVVCPVCVGVDLTERHFKLHTSPHLCSTGDWDRFLDDCYMRTGVLGFPSWELAPVG